MITDNRFSSFFWYLETDLWFWHTIVQGAVGLLVMQWKTGSTVVITRRRLTRPRVFRWHEMYWCGQPTSHRGLRCEERHFELYEKDCQSFGSWNYVYNRLSNWQGTQTTPLTCSVVSRCVGNDDQNVSMRLILGVHKSDESLVSDCTSYGGVGASGGVLKVAWLSRDQSLVTQLSSWICYHKTVTSIKVTSLGTCLPWSRGSRCGTALRHFCFQAKDLVGRFVVRGLMQNFKYPRCMTVTICIQITVTYNWQWETAKYWTKTRKNTLPLGSSPSGE